jgi:DnaJ-class molecular chaperone
MSDHYNTLGVARNATPDDIKKAYRRMAAIHHPDKGGDTAEFQKIQSAYETLSDPQKKQQYDNPNPFNGGGMPGGMHGFPGGFQFHMNGFDMNDIFGQMFGGRAHNPQMPSYRTTLVISLEQAYSGEEQTMNFNGPHGPQTVKITIPKGVEDGQSLRYDNLIKNSILLVDFRIQPHPKFQRDGVHLHSTHEINVLDLIVGGSFKFNTISGKTLDVSIKPGTQPGSNLRLQGEGMVTDRGTGDQYVLLKPFIPDRIDKRITDVILQTRTI